MSNKPISSIMAIVIVFLTAIVVVAIVLAKMERFNCEVASFGHKASFSLAKKPNTFCKERVFKGKAQINVWQDKENGKTIINVEKKDLDKLPFPEAQKFVLIDLDPNTQKKLSKSSQEKPTQIEITGFAKKCSGINLASLEYKKGIFSSYLVD